MIHPCGQSPMQTFQNKEILCLFSFSPLLIWPATLYFPIGKCSYSSHWNLRFFLLATALVHWIWAILAIIGARAQCGMHNVGDSHFSISPVSRSAAEFVTPHFAVLPLQQCFECLLHLVVFEAHYIKVRKVLWFITSWRG